MSRTKQVPFTDSLAVWAETADEQEIRDGVNMLSVYCRQRKFAFKVRIEAVTVATVIKNSVFYTNSTEEK